MGSPLVSIIIPSFKRAAYLGWHLRSLGKIDPLKHEIIVVNDGIDGDGTEDVARAFGTRYLFTGNRNESGEIWRCPSFAANYGVKRARAEIIILTCPEMFHFGPSVGLMLDALLGDDMLLTTPRNVYDDYFGDFKKRLDAKHWPTQDAWEEYFEHKVPDHPFKPNPGMPYFMGMKKQRFIDIGGYDEDFTGIGADDNDLVDRLLASGSRLHYVPADVVHVFHGVKKMADMADDPRYQHNCKLWRQRKGTVKRNIGRTWGEG